MRRRQVPTLCSMFTGEGGGSTPPGDPPHGEYWIAQRHYGAPTAITTTDPGWVCYENSAFNPVLANFETTMLYKHEAGGADRNGSTIFGGRCEASVTEDFADLLMTYSPSYIASDQYDMTPWFFNGWLGCETPSGFTWYELPNIDAQGLRLEHDGSTGFAVYTDISGFPVYSDASEANWDAILAHLIEAVSASWSGYGLWCAVEFTPS